VTPSEIKQSLNIKESDSEALIIEKLFCCALLSESMDVINRVISKVIEWRDVLKSEQTPGKTIQNKPYSGFTEIRRCTIKGCENLVFPLGTKGLCSFHRTHGVTQ
jgi:hypothetical protein